MGNNDVGGVGWGGGAQWAKLRGQAMQLNITLHCEDLR